MSTDPPAAVGRCLACDYLLRDLSTPRCPECGRAFDPADPSTMNLSGRPLVRGLTRWLLKPVGWWTVAAALLLTAGLYYFTWLPFVGDEARSYLAKPLYWPFYGWCEGWTYAGLTATAKKWYEGHHINLCDTRTVLLLVLAAVVLGTWVVVRTVLAVIVAAVRHRGRELLRAAWRRWACLAALGLLFWSGLKYDLAFHAAAWLSGPAIDRLAADITSRPPQFRYPDRQVGLFPAKNIYWKDNTVGFQLDRPIARTFMSRRMNRVGEECWMKIHVSQSADGRHPPVDEDAGERVVWEVSGIANRFDAEDRSTPPDYVYGAGGLRVALKKVNQRSPWVRARRQLARQLAGQADPPPDLVRALVRELTAPPEDWTYGFNQGAMVRKVMALEGLPAGGQGPQSPENPDAPSVTPAHALLLVDLSRAWPSVPLERPVARELVHLGRKAVPALVEALDPAEPALAEQAATVLARTGPVAAPAEARLLALLNHPNADVARAAVFALYRLEKTSPASLPALVAALDSPDACLRRYAMQNLRFVEAPPEALRPIFRRALGHADRQVRIRAALGLWQVGPDAAAVADLRAVLDEVNRRAATQPQRSSLALGMDDGLRVVCAAAIQQVAPDDVHARAVLTDYADRVSPYLHLLEVKRDGSAMPGLARRVAALPRLAWAVLAESVTGRDDRYRAMYLRRLTDQAADRADPLDVRDERLASAVMLRLLQPPDVSLTLLEEACQRAIELSMRRLHGHRAVAADLAAEVDPFVPPMGTVVYVLAWLRTPQVPLDVAWLDIQDAAEELSLNERVAAAEQFFALAQCTRGLVGHVYRPAELAAKAVQPRLRQAILDHWRQLDPEQVEVAWGAERSRDVVLFPRLSVSRRREALQTLADLARRPGRVGDAARKAMREVLDTLARGDAVLYSAALATQLELDPAAARVGWDAGQRRTIVQNLTTSDPVQWLQVVRVLADAGWLPQQDWADLAARAGSDDPAVVLGVRPVLCGLIAMATQPVATAPAGR